MLKIEKGENIYSNDCFSSFFCINKTVSKKKNTQNEQSIFTDQESAYYASCI